MLCLIEDFNLRLLPPSPDRRSSRSVEICSVGIVHDGLYVVSREEARGLVHHAFVPAVVVLLDHVDDGTLLEGELVLFVASVVVNGHHCGGSRELDVSCLQVRNKLLVCFTTGQLVSNLCQLLHTLPVAHLQLMPNV